MGNEVPHHAVYPIPSLSVPNIHLSIMLRNVHNLCASLNATDQMSHSLKQTVLSDSLFFTFLDRRSEDEILNWVVASIYQISPWL
jgi:hypothetical protein